jgi:hypothetical protein
MRTGQCKSSPTLRNSEKVSAHAFSLFKTALMSTLVVIFSFFCFLVPGHNKHHWRRRRRRRRI